MSHTSIGKFKDWQVFCNHHNEGKGEVHRHTDRSNLPRNDRWQVAHYIHTLTPAKGARKEMRTGGRTVLLPLCSQGAFSPHSCHWQGEQAIQEVILQLKEYEKEK